MNNTETVEFKKDDYVSCVYDDEELLGKIVRKTNGGYIVNLLITHYANGDRLMQEIALPADRIKPVEFVVQEPLKYKKREKKDE